MSFWRRRKHKHSSPATPPLPENVEVPTPSEVLGRISADFDAAEAADLHYHDPHGASGVVKDIGAIPFRSESCASHHFLLSCYPYWCDHFKEGPRHHRKQWEFVYILQALWERGYLSDGKRGLGFGVGKEPLAAIMAKHGCEVVATDLDPEAKASAAWAQTNQHSSTLADLNERGICDPEAFDRLVTFQPADMNNISDDLRGFDFCWSACCFEHLGSIEAGLAFYRNSLDTLNPGGLAIHTTELNLSSDEDTLEKGDTVLFRKKDLIALIDDLTAQGHYCEPLLIHHGSQPLDGFVDMPPYLDDPHLRLGIAQYVTTSVGIITRKKL